MTTAEAVVLLASFVHLAPHTTAFRLTTLN
jgi:hypothetical protein